MALKNTIRTHIVGSEFQLKNNDLSTLLRFLVQLFSLARYLLIYNIWSCKTWLVEQSVESKCGIWLAKMIGRALICIPFVGEALARAFDRIIAAVKFKKLPLMRRIKQFLETLFQLSLVDLTLRNANIKFIQTGDPLQIETSPDKPQTALLIANHRSIMDYTLINCLVQGDRPFGAPEYLWSLLKGQNLQYIPKLKFVSWGRISNMPSIGFIANIMMKDENAAISTSDVESFLKQEGNQILAMFPEVNVLTPELRLVQRKLTKDSYLPMMNNVLYPRFKNFTSTVKCLAHLQHVEKSRKVRYLRKAVTRASGMVSKVKHSKSKVDAEEIAQVSLFLGEDGLDAPTVNVATRPKLLKTSLRIDPFVWDFTIVYYRAKLSSGREHAHVHKLELHRIDEENDHYQLEQITPSFLQLLGSRFQDSPILIRIHLNKYPLSNLMKLSDRKLESWLEKTWLEKDLMLDSMQKNVKIN